METNPEKDSGVLGSLFQTVINDMRGSTPIWEDFTYKSMKLHSSLKTTVVTIGAFLEAFQKVADMATSSKDILSLFRAVWLMPASVAHSTH
ncbi:metastasis suppressor protein 1 [Plakobranchus ocellatus]|uniref:Metastasis suppressor protein 1 n=1 Tax=Plakobranchus ocellatus TaxID=259542 RepID=A0AAV4CSD9_9GAST|nr:metastasis suppressor protein 1 [Plakobranchus ocellatus]